MKPKRRKEKRGKTRTINQSLGQVAIPRASPADAGTQPGSQGSHKHNLQRRTPSLRQEPLALPHESGIQRGQRRSAVFGRREPSAEVAPGREVRPRPQGLVARRLDLGPQRVQLDARLRRPRELLPERVALGFEPGDAFLEGVDALRVRCAPAQLAPQRFGGLAGRVRDALGRTPSQRLDFGSSLLEGPPAWFNP